MTAIRRIAAATATIAMLMSSAAAFADCRSPQPDEQCAAQNLAGKALYPGNRSHADGASFSGANLSGATLAFDCRHCDFSGIKAPSMRTPVGPGPLLAESNFQGAQLNYALLGAANFDHADFSSANLAHASMVGSSAILAKFTDADLRGAALNDANLAMADLSHADLRGANLTGTSLRGANLAGADLSGAITGNGTCAAGSVGYCILPRGGHGAA